MAKIIEIARDIKADDGTDLLKTGDKCWAKTTRSGRVYAITRSGLVEMEKEDFVWIQRGSK